MTKNVLWALLGLTAAACGGAGAAPAQAASAPASSGAAPAGSAKVAGSPNGGPGPEQIRAILKDHTRDIRACYDREKDRGMSFKGETKFKVKIAPDGKVSDVQGVDVEPAAEFLSSCVQGLMKGWTFPTSPGGSSIVVPVNW